MGRIDLLFELEREQGWSDAVAVHLPPPPAPYYGPPQCCVPRRPPPPRRPWCPPRPQCPPKPSPPSPPPPKPQDSAPMVQIKKPEPKEKPKPKPKPEEKPKPEPSIRGSQEYNRSINGSQPDDDRVTDIFKDYGLYLLAAKNGTRDDFERALNQVSATENVSCEDVMCRLSPAGNTFLHVAAKHENVEIVNFIVEKEPSLLLSENFKKETALHLVVKAGHESTVKELVGIYKRLLGSGLPPENVPANLLRSEDERGNTALHEALFNVRGSIAEYLIEEDPELSYYRNNDGESALYLAAKAGSVDWVSLILGSLTDQERVNKLFKKKSPIQAAIQGKHRDVLKAMFAKNSNLIRLRDEEGRNPLHYAASLGNLEDVRYLLTTERDSLGYARNPTRRDEMGAFPIHLASTEGHVDVVRLLLGDCPDPGELLDGDYRNILHVAAVNGRSDIVNFILKNPDLGDLINMKDRDGNTPLHLAAIHFHPKIVSDLTWDKRVNINLANHRGRTALSVAEDYMPCTPQFTQTLTWAALKAAGTPRSLSGKTVGRMNLDHSKDMVKILLVVSTLVATVTYAAGFTMPGGYNSSESDRDVGMSTMTREKAFHVFVFCDTIALYNSIVAIVALLWAHFRDSTLAFNALTLAVPFLGIALSMMSMAFTAGVFLVVNKLRWLSMAVLVLGITFLLIMFLLLLPYFTPLTSRNGFLRRLSYYPFRLLILASSKRLVV